MSGVGEVVVGGVNCLRGVSKRAPKSSSEESQVFVVVYDCLVKVSVLAG
jgi:hypothetical protein